MHTYQVFRSEDTGLDNKTTDCLATGLQLQPGCLMLRFTVHLLWFTEPVVGMHVHIIRLWLMSAVSKQPLTKKSDRVDLNN